MRCRSAGPTDDIPVNTRTDDCPGSAYFSGPTGSWSSLPDTDLVFTVFVEPPPATPTPAVGDDTTAPDTTITSQPKIKTKKSVATFTFVSSEPASFQCKLETESGFSDCTSPVTIKVGKGKHTFQVRAKDAAGNTDPTPATFDWKVKKKK